MALAWKKNTIEDRTILYHTAAGKNAVTEGSGPDSTVHGITNDNCQRKYDLNIPGLTPCSSCIKLDSRTRWALSWAVIVLHLFLRHRERDDGVYLGMLFAKVVSSNLSRSHVLLPTVQPTRGHTLDLTSVHAPRKPQAVCLSSNS